MAAMTTPRATPAGAPRSATSAAAPVRVVETTAERSADDPPEITALSRPSLTCFVAMPFGLTLGAVGDDATHRAIVHATMEEAYRDHPAGSTVPLPFRWDGDDLRARQLRKQAL